MFSGFGDFEARITRSVEMTVRTISAPGWTLSHASERVLLQIRTLGLPRGLTPADFLTQQGILRIQAALAFPRSYQLSPGLLCMMAMGRNTRIPTFFQRIITDDRRRQGLQRWDLFSILNDVSTNSLGTSAPLVHTCNAWRYLRISD